MVDSTGATIQAPQTFTVASSVPLGTEGVVMIMRSFLGGLPSNAPAYLKPEQGQKIANATYQATPINDNNPPDFLYSWTLDNPDSYSAYFTSATAQQGITNPGAVNMDWVAFDPFGVGLAQNFTLQITGALDRPDLGLLHVRPRGVRRGAVHAEGRERDRARRRSDGRLVGDDRRRLLRVPHSTRRRPPCSRRR